MFATRLGEAIAETRGPQEAEGAAAIDRDWLELRAAVDWSVRAERVDLAVPLVAGLGFEATFRERGEVLQWADRVLALPGVLDHPRADELLGTAGLSDWAYGRFDLGLSRAEAAVRLHHERGTRLTPDVAAALPLQVSLRGDLDRTTAILHAHREEARRAEVPFAFGHMYVCEAMACAYAGLVDAADELLREAHAVAEDVACPLLRAIVAFTGAIALVDRDPLGAAEHARSALTIGASVRATWFLGAGSNYLVAALARTERPADAVPDLLATLDRLLHGATVHSAANAIRNTITVLDRCGEPARAARLVGWLTTNRPSIPGSPGMRSHPIELGERLAAQSRAHYDREAAAGAGLPLIEALAHARSCLVDLQQ